MKISTIETAIIKLLGNSFKKYKITSVPVVDFVRQNTILNLEYTGEEFISPNSLNNTFSAGKVSVLTYDLTIYYKDLRNTYEEVHDILDTIIEKIHGKQLEIAESFYCSPIVIDKIEFKEKNAQNFIIYTCSLKVKIGR
jgi:hypothetical protein